MSNRMRARAIKLLIIFKIFFTLHSPKGLSKYRQLQSADAATEAMSIKKYDWGNDHG